MTVIYWLAGAFALAAFVSAKYGRGAAPAVLFTIISLCLMAVTPVGHDVVNFVANLGGKVSEASK